MSRPRDIYCRGCDYQLRGLPAGTCPECGRAFDPDQPRTLTFRRLSTRRRIATWLSRLFVGYLWFLVLAAAVQSVYGGEPLIMVVAGTLCPGFIWFILLIAVAVARAEADMRSHGRLFLGCAAGMLVLASIVFLQWPFTVAFFLARPALDRAADRIEAGAAVSGEWVGPFYIQSGTASTSYDNNRAFVDMWLSWDGPWSWGSWGQPILIRMSAGAEYERPWGNILDERHISGDWWLAWDE